MKKLVSLTLSVLMVLTAAGMVQAGAAEVATSFKDDTGFHFSFENESDFAHPDMQLDSIGLSQFKTPGVTRYCEGAYGSKGAVAVAVETASGNGNVNDGVSGIKMFPGKEYDLTMDLKLFSPENFANLPNVNLFFMTQGVQMYEDTDCTKPLSVSSSDFQLFSIPGSSVFQFEEDGKTVSGDWSSFHQKITLTNSFSGKFVKSDEPVSVKLFIRMGANAHALTSTSDFTPEFVAQCGTVSETDTRAALWMEYAIDNIGLWPASIIPEEPAEEDTALWRGSFEDNGWASETHGVTFEGNYAKALITSDVPADIQDRSKGALEPTYTGNTDNGGYLDFNTVAATNEMRLQYNRVYEISFWAKGSSAVEDFYKSSGRKTALIPERNGASRLDRTFPMWTSYTVNEPITTEWTKYTYLFYEEMPMALGRDGDNVSTLRFHVRYSCVPNTKTNNLTAEVGGETINYAYQSKSGEYYKLEDFKIYLDDFTVTPLDIAYNGDFAVKDENQSNYTVVWYSGGTNTYRVAQPGNDVLSPGVFHNGVIETISDFPGADSKNVLKVTKDGGAPYQGADIENGKKYQISFWAKADDAESVGQPINLVLDRDIQGQILDNSEPTYTDVPKWAGYRLDTSVTKDITLNKEHYDGYGAPKNFGTNEEPEFRTGSVPFYMYGGTIANAYHKPGELTPTNYEETLVYDDYYDRMFAKNTQLGNEPTAWAYQYYDGTAWAGTNDKAEITSDKTLSGDWTLYTMEYEWNYPGKHYRVPNLTFLDNASYSLADIKIEALEGEDPNAKPAFHIENLAATADKEILSTSDSIRLTWNFVSTGAADAKEAAGGSLVKVYADNNGKLALIGTTRADQAGAAEIKAGAALFGKSLVFEVIPADTNGNYGIGATAAFSGRVATAVESELAVNPDQNSADWSVTIAADNISGTADIYVATYNQNNKLISISQEQLAYASGENNKTGNIAFSANADKVKLFVWDGELKPMCTEKEITFMPVNNDPFAGDNEINVVFLGGSITEGAGASAPAKCYANLTGEWFKKTYGTTSRTVNYYNKGVGGTPSDYGLLRFTRDVVNLNPDVVFIEFAVNDGGRDTRMYMESMVRTLLSLPTSPYVVFLYTTNETYSTPTAFHEQVAEYYGIPQISLKDALKRELNGANARDAGYLKDSVHPSDQGYQVYFNEITKCLETGRFYQRPIPQKEKLVAASGAVETEFIPISNDRITKSGNDWTTGGTGNRQWGKTTTIGATLKFSFDGTILAVEHGLLSASGMYEIYVDGEKKGTGDPYYGDRALTDSPQLVMGYANYALPDGHHDVEIKTIQSTNSNSEGDNVFLYNIITGSPVK